jgi:predicted Zn finger-like uncharacterized protein
MSETATCPKCQRSLRIPDSLLGQRVKCPACATTFTASANGAGASPPEEEEAPPRPERRSRRPPPRDEEEEAPRRRPARQEEDEDERPISRKIRRDEEDEEGPSRPSRRRDDDDQDEDDRPRRRSRRAEKPGKVQAIGIMVLIGGILALVVGLSWAASCFGLLWPGTYYAFVVGIMAIIKGAQVLGEGARNMPPPKGIGIMMIINIVCLDVVNLALGIVVLVFCGDEEVKAYFRG